MTTEEKFEEWYKQNSEEYDLTKGECRRIWVEAFTQGHSEGNDEAKEKPDNRERNTYGGND
jgi:hypothetical protein